jgi:hypothetical protein
MCIQEQEQNATEEWSLRRQCRHRGEAGKRGEKIVLPSCQAGTTIVTVLDETTPATAASGIEAAADAPPPHRHGVSIESAEEAVAVADLAVSVVEGAVMTTTMAAIVVAAVNVAAVAAAIIDPTVVIEIVIEIAKEIAIEIVIEIVVEIETVIETVIEIEIESRVKGIGREGEGVRGVALRITITADRGRAAATAIAIEVTVGGRAEEEEAEMTMTLLGMIEITNLKVGKRSSDDDAAEAAAGQGAGVAEGDVDVADRPLSKGGGAIRGIVMLLVRIPRLFPATGIGSIVCLVIVVAAK